MSKIALLGSTTDHGGHIYTASPNVLANGIQVARYGDGHYCPQEGHGYNNIVSGSPTTKANGLPVARVGDTTSCGATIITGSPNVDVD